MKLSYFTSFHFQMETFLILENASKESSGLKTSYRITAMDSCSPCPPSRHPSLPQDWVQAGGWAAVTMPCTAPALI